jgi:hypothetical protein
LHVLRTQIPEHYFSENSGIIMVLGKKSIVLQLAQTGAMSGCNNASHL